MTTHVDRQTIYVKFVSVDVFFAIFHSAIVLQALSS